MTIGYFVLGLLLLIGIVVDLLWTTLWVEGGAGPLTSRLMAVTWQTVRWVDGRNSRVLTLTGPLILTVGFTLWLILLWAGWTLVFAGAENILIDTIDGGSISWIDRIYFTGYAMFTLGNGDFAPRGGVWQIATVLVTGSGMLFITLGVTYILSVLEAVTQKRSFATGISGLGMQGDEFVRNAWDGQDFQGLDILLNTYITQLNALTTNHKAYPVLHYFHSEQPEQAPVTSIAVLHDALIILEFGIPAQERPSDAIIENARSSVESYLEALHGTFIEPAHHTPPPPALDVIRDAEIPTNSDDEFIAALGNLEKRRRTMLGLVESDARQWPTRRDA